MFFVHVVGYKVKNDAVVVGMGIFDKFRKDFIASKSLIHFAR